MKRRSLVLVAALAACSSPRARTSSTGAGASSAAPSDSSGDLVVSYNHLARLDFNRRAAEEALPLFWRTDADGDRAIDPEELVALWGWEGPALDTLVVNGAFTPAFAAAYARLEAPASNEGQSAAETERRTAIVRELAQGQTTLVETDLREASAEDRAIVEHIGRAAVLIERIFARQSGVLQYAEALAAADPASRMVGFRNQGPFCEAPQTENDPNCIALAARPKRVSGLYPVALQEKAKFCEVIAKQKNAEELMGHFSVVVEGKRTGTYAVMPYHVAYATEVEAIAIELEGAAAAITSPEEQPFTGYLRAAARAFRKGDWESADQAWVEMGAKPSRWYLRIGPDEVYHDPCALKAGFHVSFARINPDSVAWRNKLEPVKSELEGAMATLAGAPYKARDVKFTLPDFIDIVLNAGYSRNAHGATVGQSLPNWGKVADAGGRTVAMTNLYTDADSATAFLGQTSSLFCKATQARVSTDPTSSTMSTVLHEAAHNLGPAHNYRVKGKTDDEIFGGPLASTLEELKAQTAALYFSEWLAARNVITRAAAEDAHVRDVAWALGHVSRGMYTADGTPKNYSQLASIQLGTLLKAKVLIWRAEETAANGTDRGCFDIDLVAWPAAVDKMAAHVTRIKATGDSAAARALVAAFVDAKDGWAKLREVITERWQRAPRASFVYSFRDRSESVQ